MRIAVRHGQEADRSTRRTPRAGSAAQPVDDPADSGRRAYLVHVVDPSGVPEVTDLDLRGVQEIGEDRRSRARFSEPALGQLECRAIVAAQQRADEVADRKACRPPGPVPLECEDVRVPRLLALPLVASVPSAYRW